jgi:acetyl esterase/lipase
VSVRRGVLVREVGGVRLAADVYRPARRGRAARPAVVLVHGGGWIIGSRADWRAIGTRLARAGFVAVAVDYRLDGPDRYPDQVDDVAHAVRWVRRRASTLRVDPTRIALMGASAGGNLAALAGARGRGPTDAGDRVAAVVSWSGVYSHATLVDDSTRPVSVPAGCRDLGCQPPATLPELVRTYMGAPPSDAAGRYRAASPVHTVDPTDPPMLLADSTREFVPAAQLTEMAERLAAEGVTHETFRFAGTRHAGQLAGVVLGPTISFLRRALAPGSA